MTRLICPSTLICPIVRLPTSNTICILYCVTGANFCRIHHAIGGDHLDGRPEFRNSRVVRKPAFSICENKDADQLLGNREADQRLCFRYTDSTISLLPKSEISSLQPSSVAVQPGLCGTWSETPKTGFLRTRLVCYTSIQYTAIKLRLLK